VVGLDKGGYENLESWVPVIEAINIARPDDATVEQVGEMLRESDEYFQELVAARRAQPRDDMVSDLVQATVDGSSLSDEELVATLLTLAIGGIALAIGGINTTKCLLGNMLVRLTEDPDRWSLLRESPEEIPPAWTRRSVSKRRWSARSGSSSNPVSSAEPRSSGVRSSWRCSPPRTTTRPTCPTPWRCALPA
jgi:hypothetical protein